MTKAEIEILATLLGAGGDSYTIEPRPYGGLKPSREYNAALSLQKAGLVVVTEEGHSFFAYSRPMWNERRKGIVSERIMALSTDEKATVTG